MTDSDGASSLTSAAAPPSVTLGKLVRASARVAWPHEAHAFTPWLASNLDSLSEALGLKLTLIEVEHAVGRYSADLLLEDTDGRRVIVENQFGQTDHDHLGKLLTYCAGSDARVVIWISETLNDEHLAAMEWLNQNTGEDVGFFGVELELLQIGDSPYAPNFRVRVRPNSWVKAERSAVERRDWSWETYQSELGIASERIDIGRYLVEAVQGEVSRRSLPWTIRWRQGYVAFQRPGGYNVIQVDLWYSKPPRLIVKLPGSLEELGTADPLPMLDGWWSANYKEWSWHVPSKASVSDLRGVVELAAAAQPEHGPFKPGGGAAALGAPSTLQAAPITAEGPPS